VHTYLNPNEHINGQTTVDDLAVILSDLGINCTVEALEKMVAFKSVTVDIS
jgi:hypothetical protein